MLINMTSSLPTSTIVNGWNEQFSVDYTFNKQVTQPQVSSLESESESKLALIPEINIYNDFHAGTVVSNSSQHRG